MSSNLITVLSCLNNHDCLPWLTKLTRAVRAVCSSSRHAGLLSWKTDSTKQYIPEGDAIANSEGALSFIITPALVFGVGQPTSRTSPFVEKMTNPTRAYSPFLLTPYAHR